MPLRRTFATALRAFAHSMVPALRHPWLRLAPNAGSWARAAPHRSKKPRASTREFLGGMPVVGKTLIIGCGNLLRGDDAVGPVLVRRLWERGLRAGVECADGGTGGMDVAFQMRGCAWVILVDACRRIPGEEVAEQRGAGFGGAGFGGGTSLVAVDLEDSVQCSSSLYRPPAPRGSHLPCPSRCPQSPPAEGRREGLPVPSSRRCWQAQPGWRSAASIE